VRRQLENVLEEPQPEANEAEAKAAERAAKAAKRREENKEAADGSDDDVLERAYRYEVNECNEMLRKRCAPTYECNGARGVEVRACTLPQGGRMQHTPHQARLQAGCHTTPHASAKAMAALLVPHACAGSRTVR